jgi:hypothetical protein
MFFGRPFAYLSLPGVPVYVGDMVLAVGLLEAVRTQSAIRSVVAASRPLKVLLAFMVVCGLRFVVSFPVYGFDAIRDSAIWYYGTYAFLVAAAAMSDPTFTPRLVGWYRRIIPAFFVWAPIAVILSRMSTLGFVPGSATPINAFQPGDIALHAAIAIAFLWLGLDRAPGQTPWRPSSQLLVPFGFLALLAAGSQNRGGLLAGLCVLGVTLCCMPGRGRRRAVASGACSLAVVSLLVLLFDVRIPLKDRDLSLQQVRTNVTSVLQPSSRQVTSDKGNLQGNVNWRLDYWEAVKKDALSPSYVLNGRGFGPILAYEYGIDAPRPDRGPPLRSAHNSHLTVLARTGLPGLALWVLIWLVWIRHIVRHGLPSRRDRWAARARLSALMLAAVIGYLVNTYFDPSLDGPKGAIWIWSLMGLGAVYAAMGRSTRTINRAASHGGRPSGLAPVS